MAHGDLRFERSDRFQRDADDNQNRSTAEGDVGFGDHREDDREHCDQAEEDSAHEGDLRNDFREVINRGLAGPNTGDRAVVFADRVRNFHGVELDRGVEVVERQDQQKVKNPIEHTVIMEESEKLFPEAALFRSHKGLDHAGQRHKRHSEDDRQDTGHVDLNRNEGRLAAVHLTSYDPFRVGYRDPSFRIGHEHDERDHDNKYDDDQRYDEVVFRFIRAELPPGRQRNKRIGATGKDTGEKDDRDTVSDALFSDLIAHPHDQHGTGYEAGHDDDAAEHAGETGVVVQDTLLIAENEVVHDAHRKRKAESRITGDFLDLLLTVVALLGESFERRDGDGQKLNDNGSVNIRRD